MSDNTPFQADPLQVIASDDVGGVKHQRVKLEVGADGVATDVQPPDADGKAATTAASVGNMLSNGTTFDVERCNIEGTAIASAAFTSTQTSADIKNVNGRGLHVALNISATAGAVSLVLTIEGKDSASGNYYALNAAPNAVVGTGITVYSIYPGLGAATGGVTQRTSGTLPRTFHIKVTAGNATSATYSVGYSLIV